jgi:PLP dependent protein
MQKVRLPAETKGSIAEGPGAQYVNRSAKSSHRSADRAKFPFSPSLTTPQPPKTDAKTVPNAMNDSLATAQSPQPNSVVERWRQVQAQVSDLIRQFGPGHSVQVLAVSKFHPASAIRTLAQLGHLDFGENYLQEALSKQSELQDLPIRWHFIGQIQSNKTRPIAEQFAWAHTVDRLKIAQRLSEQRPTHLPPLNICLQVKWIEEPGKGGAWPSEVPNLAKQIAALPNIKLRGLMCLPPPSDDFAEQRRYFDDTKTLLDQLNASGMNLDTLSMGTSADLAAAIAAGATMVRIGTAIFGERSKPLAGQ